MHVLHVVPLITDGAAYGGPVRGTFRQCKALREAGHTTDVLALSSGRPSAIDSEGWVVTYPFHRIPGHAFAGAISFPALWWAARHARDYDVVHLHAGRDLWILLVALVLRVRGVPFVWQTHGMLAPRSHLPARLLDPFLTRPAVRSASALLYLTDYERRDLETFSATAPKVHIINGVDEVDVQINDVSRDSLVFISRIHARKRLGDLIRAVDLLSSRPNIRLTVFGPDEGDLARCRRLAQDLGLSDRVAFRGPLKYSEVRSELRRHSMMVLPSEKEPFPNIVLEALATGMLVICTEECGIAAYIQEAHAGRVSPLGAHSLAQTIGEMLDLSQSERDHQASRARDLATRSFSMEAVARSLVECYETATSGRARTPVEAADRK